MTTSRWCSIQERHILPEALQYFDSLWIADHFYGFDAPEVTPGVGMLLPVSPPPSLLTPCPILPRLLPRYAF